MTRIEKKRFDLGILRLKTRARGFSHAYNA